MPVGIGCGSNAPIEHCAGRGRPRWSVGVQDVGFPALRAGLIARRARVSVGPPLSARAARSGLMLCSSPAPRPHWLRLSRFPPSDTGAAVPSIEQFVLAGCPEEPLAMIVFASLRECMPDVLEMRLPAFDPEARAVFTAVLLVSVTP